MSLGGAEFGYLSESLIRVFIAFGYNYLGDGAMYPWGTPEAEDESHQRKNIPKCDTETTTTRTYPVHSEPHFLGGVLRI